MCGRFNLFASAEEVAALFDLMAVPLLAPRYNIAPTQPVAAVRLHPHTRQRELTHFVWGLIPSWAQDPKIGLRMINARSETAAEKPSFRNAFKRRRCLIPASGFYEWAKLNDGKQPMHIQLRDQSVMALAGLYEYWSSADGSEIESCTILTTRPNEFMQTIHNRMPVIVDSADFDLWLDPDAPLAALPALFEPFSAERMTAYPVSTVVNSPRNDDPVCIAPLTV
ncbi:MAG: SOS response-associated peptidase [Anaerolineae bacterium]|nr:SOS response-associated peptidase [Anaerolineae bacterium]